MLIHKAKICGEYIFKENSKTVNDFALNTLVFGLVIKVKPMHRIKTVKLIQDTYDMDLREKKQSEIRCTDGLERTQIQH